LRRLLPGWFVFVVMRRACRGGGPGKDAVRHDFGLTDVMPGLVGSKARLSQLPVSTRGRLVRKVAGAEIGTRPTPVETLVGSVRVLACLAG
jgi:hypothetical protein